MRRVQVVRRAARGPLTDDEPAVDDTAESALSRRRATRDAEVAEALARIDAVTAA